MDNVLLVIFSFTSGIASLVLSIAVILALIGYFTKNNIEKQQEYYTNAGKLLLVFALLFVLGLGSCVGLIFAS